MRYDVVIIGAGPGGLAAANILAAAGKKVAVVERGKFGGTCLNAGCIPTKMLLAAAEPGESAAALMRQKEVQGELTINYTGLQKRVWRYVGATSDAAEQSLASLGVDCVSGQARFLSAHELEVVMPDAGRRCLQTDWVIIASGSAPAAFPAMRPDHDCLLDSTDILRLNEPPKTLLVIGAGAIGLEFASFFSALGTKISLVEAMSQLAPTEDADLAGLLQKLLLKRGYDLHIGQKARSLVNADGRAVLTFEDGQTVMADKALLAVGRRGGADELDAGAAGIRLTSRGFVEVDENLLAAPGIFAVGDCNGRVLLAHAAAHQAAYAARKILGSETGSYKSGPVPACVYGAVEMMRVGANESQALKSGGKVESSLAELARNPIAQAHAQPQGFVKAIWRDDALVGISAIGAHVTQLVTAAELMVAGGFWDSRLDAVMLAHPTLDEALGEAVRAPRRPLAQ